MDWKSATRRKYVCTEGTSRDLNEAFSFSVCGVPHPLDLDSCQPPQTCFPTVPTCCIIYLSSLRRSHLLHGGLRSEVALVDAADAIANAYDDVAVGEPEFGDSFKRGNFESGDFEDASGGGVSASPGRGVSSSSGGGTVSFWGAALGAPLDVVPRAPPSGPLDVALGAPLEAVPRAPLEGAP